MILENLAFLTLGVGSGQRGLLLCVVVARNTRNSIPLIEFRFRIEYGARDENCPLFIRCMHFEPKMALVYTDIMRLHANAVQWWLLDKCPLID